MMMGLSRRLSRYWHLTTQGRILLLLGALTSIATSAQAQQSTTFDDLLEKLKDKGVLSQGEYNSLKAAREEETAAQREARRKQALKEAQQAEKDDKAKDAAANQTKFVSSPGMKSIQLFGDVRLRYEAREATSTFPIAGLPPNSFDENLDRWRYAVRVGIRGDITEDWFYGLRLDTSDNPRSSWVTFGNSSANPAQSTAPYGKQGSQINVGQAYMGWRATPWLTVQAGRMPNPVYTTPMVWDPDFNPEGIAERINYPLDDKLSVFGNFAQYVYQTYNPQTDSIAHDGYQFAWQGGAEYKFAHATSAKAAIGFYNYSGFGSQAQASNGGASGFRGFFARGPENTIGANAFNDAVNSLSYVEIPWEFNFPVASGGIVGRAFGDVAWNTQADQRAAQGSYASLGSQGLAWQVGLSVGTAIGLTINQGNPKKHDWEARAYWQQIDLNALDPNLIDSDFFEGRTNIHGLFFAVAYSPADAIITTFRFGEAHRFNEMGPTPGSNADLPNVAPITSYRLLQFDLTWKF
jgi:Putative porin